MNEFYISTLSNKSLFLSVGGVVLLVPALLIIGFIYFWIGLSSSKISFVDETVKIDTVFYGNEISINDINIEGIKLYTDTDYQLSYRTNGVSLLGVNWGWFKMNNNRKALVFITDISNAVFIPTKRNYDIIVSIEATEKFINNLKRSTK